MEGPVGTRILILDDDREILSVLEQFLEGEGYVCRTTTSPSDALESVSQGGIDLVITDIRMPDVSGIEVVQQIKQQDDTIAIIMLTALSEVTSAVESLRAGADDYLLKPFNLNEISVAVIKALEKRSLLLENRSYQAVLERRVEAATADLRETNEQLRETHDYLEGLLHSTVDAILTVDDAGIIEFVNRGTLRLLGYEAKDLVGSRIGDLFVGGSEENQYIHRVIRHEKPIQNYSTEFRHRDGRLIPVSISVSLVRRADEKNSTLLICKDVTEQRRLQDELKEMSIRDSLSGLYNQRYFYERIESEIERARRQKHPLSLLLFDIDNFKGYNDSRGHLEGDRVIAEAGKVVMECTREHVDLGFRYGGDEFTVLLPEADEAQALHIAKRIQKTFEARQFDHLTVSIGLMTYKDGYSLKSFIQYTDSMMFDAKRAGGNRVYIYDASRVTSQ